MTKTTIQGWSLEKHSEFVKRMKPKKRPVRVNKKSKIKIFGHSSRNKSINASLSEALGYKSDPRKYVHQEMVRWMGKQDSWYKYRERDFQ